MLSSIKNYLILTINQFNEPKPTISFDEGYIAILRPDGDVVIIEDACYETETFYVIYVTGEKRGQRSYIRKRNIIKTRKATESDKEHYRLNEIMCTCELKRLCQL